MVTHPGLPQTRTCGTTAYGSSGYEFATRHLEWMATAGGSGKRSSRRLNHAQFGRSRLRRRSHLNHAVPVVRNTRTHLNDVSGLNHTALMIAVYAS